MAQPEKQITQAERESAVFSKLILQTIKVITPDKRVTNLYLHWMSFFNYGVVCGIGVGINMFILQGMVAVLPLWQANIIAILVAFLWNWTNSVGPFGYLWGLASRPQKKVKVEQIEQDKM